jgi:predicted dehydrogenase
VSIRLGIVGCGTVFREPYMRLIERLRGQGRVNVTAVYDSDPEKRRLAAEWLDLSPDLPDDVAVCRHPAVDVALVLTSMSEHGRLARAALEAGKHVLVEKPVATSLAEAEQVLAAAEAAPGHLVCAPHILLSPTYRAMHARVHKGEIGELLTARGRYGWAGPDWGRWFYEPGGGALCCRGGTTSRWARRFPSASLSLSPSRTTWTLPRSASIGAVPGAASPDCS